jgi:hypothetical protein
MHFADDMNLQVAVAQERPQILRDRNHRKIGEIRPTGANYRLYDAMGRFCGEYRASTNTTYDRTFRRVGQGNLLVLLLRSDCRSSHGHD